ncbi:hypothetical protein N8687_00270 [bacterium]|nr:hypothetical protein [bacterium]
MQSKHTIFNFEWHKESFGYGLNQKTLLVSIQASKTAISKIRALDIQIKKISTEIKHYTNDQDPEKELPAISYLITAYTNLLLNAKIPVFKEYKILAHNNESDAITQYLIAIPCWTRLTSLRALGWIKKIIDSENNTYKQAVKDLSHFGLNDTNSLPMIHGAWKNRIHYECITGRTYQLGIGPQSKTLSSSLTEDTSAPMVGICQNKHKANAYLSMLGVPVPKQYIVSNASDATLAAKSLGKQVAIKPLNQDQGRGVSAGISKENDVRKAFSLANQYGKNVIVEEFCFGVDYRVTMMQQDPIKVMQREPLHVFGDGRLTITELLEKKRINNVHRWSLNNKRNPFYIDEEIEFCLSNQGLDTNSTPVKNKRINLRLSANISKGGEQTLINIDRIHPDNLCLFKQIAIITDLYFSGIDIIMEDIEKSWLQVCCNVIEINSTPQIGKYLDPDLFEKITNKMMSRHKKPQVLLLIDFTKNESAPPSSINTHLQIAEKVLGKTRESLYIANNKGIWEGNKSIHQSNKAENFISNTRLLMLNKQADSIVISTHASELINHGLPTRQINSAILVNKNDKIPISKSKYFNKTKSILADIKTFHFNSGNSHKDEYGIQ